MIDFRYFFIFVIFFNFSLFANEVEIIQLHNKSLDQLVLDTKENNNEEKEELVLSDINSSDLEEGSNQPNETKINEEEITVTSDEVNEVESQTIFDLSENSIFNLELINKIKSPILHREFIKILSNPELGSGDNFEESLYSVTKKLYELGEIGKAHNLIKSIDFEKISNKKYIEYFYFIELNYLFSTFKLIEVCELKSYLVNESFSFKNFLLEKTDIFCLTLENRSAEAKLLNSLLVEQEKDVDLSFQNLFKYMMIEDKNSSVFEPLTNIQSIDLIFLYSAMLRINELPLNEEFIEVDALNLSIPVILSNSTKMETRLKAANKAFFDEVISIESLSALYQSVDFNSNQFNKPEETIVSLSNNKEIIMAFYYQLVNIQIFPDQRLKVILDYWKFARETELEKIAYSLTENILLSMTPNTENINFAMDIVLAQISNSNFSDALKWIELYDNSFEENDNSKYAKFLIELNETNELNTISNYLSDNYINLYNSDDQSIRETLQVLITFLEIDIEENLNAKFSYEDILDDRMIPNYFLLKDIEKSMINKDNLSILILSLLSVNNKKWKELHPEHISLILNAFKLYDNGSLIKPLIIEILYELEIF